MEHPFPYADDNKRYHTLAYHLKKRFGRRVFKASIDAGFTCPNLDGTWGTGGCTYCQGGSGAFAPGPSLSVSDQVRQEQARIHLKWKDAPVIAYFQAHTNTYAPLDTLKRKYEEALPKETVAYLAQLSQQTYLTVELGLQTIHDGTAERIHRGHSYAEFLHAYQILKGHGIRVCVHLIDGLPGETQSMMLETARAVGRLRPDAVKLHLLHILRGTPLAEEFTAGKLEPMTREAYICTVCSQLERLPPETVIAVLGGIDQEMARRDTIQGVLF